jgi:hypothetical protein
MNKCSGAGSTSLTTADASCHLRWPIAQAFGAILNPCAGGAADTVALISLATPTNLWQSIHHGKQRQRQARSKETKENHTKTPPGTSRRRPNPHPHHQKNRRIIPTKIHLILRRHNYSVLGGWPSLASIRKGAHGWPIVAGFARVGLPFASLFMFVDWTRLPRRNFHCHGSGPGLKPRRRLTPALPLELHDRETRDFLKIAEVQRRDCIAKM